MPTYTMPIPTRQEWQKLRDTNKVPKGAAKVSIGDSIDAVQKSWSLATLSKHQTATATLMKDLDAYLVVIKKKYPAFEPMVTKEVKNKVVSHQRFLADQVKAKTEYYPRYAAVMKAWEPVRDGRPNAKMKDVAKAMEKLLGAVAAFALVDSSWEPKRKELNRVMAEFERADKLTDGHTKAFKNVMLVLKPLK